MYISNGNRMGRSGPQRLALRIRMKENRKMKKLVWILTALLPCMMGLTLLAQAPQQQTMSFFVTSKGSGDGGNLSGIAGADYMCQTLAEAVGSTKTWHAYLSTRAGDNAVTILNARDRIGKGPWYNAKGQMI